MTDRRQPWLRIDDESRRIRLQVLDPVTAFDLEPEIIGRFGNALALALAAPQNVTEAIWRAVAGERFGDRTFASVLRDADQSLWIPVATDGIRVGADYLARAVAAANVDGAWIADLWRLTILGRLEIDGVKIETGRDWARLGMRPIGKWHVLAAQLRLTYGPLWLRSPYRTGRDAKTYGVKQPKDVPIAMQWAAQLAKGGAASSAIEVARSWTPVQLIEVVESTAYMAEIEMRAMDEMRSS